MYSVDTANPIDRLIEVTIVLLEGGTISTAIGPMEVFQHSGVLWNLIAGQKLRPRFKVTTASLSGKPVAADGPVVVNPTVGVEEVRKTDLIFVSAGGGLDPAEAIHRNCGLIPWLQQLHHEGARVAAVCSGVGVLAEAGILNGKRATTHWGVAKYFQHRYPKVRWCPELLITEDENVYCGGGVNACLDLSLYLVEKYCGHEIAAQCGKALVIETPRTWQVGFSLLPLNMDHRDRKIAESQEWIHQNFNRSFNVADLASHAAMSTRNFARRFRAAMKETPLGYVQKLRIAAAKRLLEQDYMTIQEIGIAVGYSDSAFFRNLFKRQTGISPDQYRRRAGIHRKI